MSLEQLIEECQQANKAWQECEGRNCGSKCDDAIEAEDRLIKFVLEHADTLIAWERQHALRTSPFDEDGS